MVNEPGWHFKEMHHSRVSLFPSSPQEWAPRIVAFRLRQHNSLSQTKQRRRYFQANSHIISFVWYIYIIYFVYINTLPREPFKNVLGEFVR